MYAFGLVLWEIARRCVTGGKLCVYPIRVLLFLFCIFFIDFVLILFFLAVSEFLPSRGRFFVKIILLYGQVRGQISN